VTVTVVSFRPQIAAVGDGLLALLGVVSDRDTDPSPATDSLAGFRMATVFGTLAALFRTLADTANPTALTLSKKTFYEGLARAARRAISGTVDTDDDGTPDTLRHAAVPRLERA
jgi:hypothetical protein